MTGKGGSCLTEAAKHEADLCRKGLLHPKDAKNSTDPGTA
jgi:hypothetical protein